MKKLNELQLFPKIGTPCVKELGAAYESGLVGSALGGGFYHTSELKAMKYKESTSTPDKPYW